MISVKDLSFSYGPNEVLKGITFDALPGELLCILGHNGAGKSTLFKCMLGILKGYKGSVTIDGSDVLMMKASEKASKVAYIPQAANPSFTYSVLDMVLMGTTPQMKGRFTPGREERDIAMQAIKKLGIEDLASRSYTKISGGEQQLVLIARALAQGAKILIMDEPTSSLDYGNQMRVQKQLAGLRNDRYTIIQSSHNPEQTYAFADRVICIKDGRIHKCGQPEEVLDDKLIRELYDIDVDMIESEDHKARFFVFKEQ